MKCQRCVEIDKESAARQASSSEILGKEHFYFPSSPSYHLRESEFCGCLSAIPQYPADDVEPVPSDWVISDQEEELIRLLIVDSDYAEH